MPPDFSFGEIDRICCHLLKLQSGDKYRTLNDKKHYIITFKKLSKTQGKFNNNSSF